jgi:integrase/recombinase XerD
MRRYLTEVRPRYLTDGTDRHVYISLYTGRQYGRAGVGELVSRYLRMHGLPRIGLHELRASAATHLVRAGASTAHVQRILGHAEIETTQQYVHIDHDALSAALAESHPRAAFENPRREQ